MLTNWLSLMKSFEIHKTRNNEKEKPTTIRSHF